MRKNSIYYSEILLRDIADKQIFSPRVPIFFKEQGLQETGCMVFICIQTGYLYHAQSYTKTSFISIMISFQLWKYIKVLTIIYLVDIECIKQQKFFSNNVDLYYFKRNLSLQQLFFNWIFVCLFLTIILNYNYNF